MTTYPYTYLAAFMNPAFAQTVVNQALRHAAKSGGPDKQRLEKAARGMGVSAPGFRPGKIPLQQLARPLVTPVSRGSQATPFTTSEEIAAPVFSLWRASQPELAAGVAAFLTAKGVSVIEALPADGLPATMTTAEMDALTKKAGAAEDTEEYDNTALMLVLLTGRAPVYEEEAAAETEGGEEGAPSEGDAPPPGGAGALE
jgi:hypothetical protein